jgi:hypothetical protein
MALSKVDFNSINVTPAASKAIKFNSSNNGLETGDLGGNMVLLSTATASSSATIDFTSNIDSTYKEYIFKFIDIHPATDSQNFEFQVDTGTNTNYNQTITSSVFRAYHDEGDSATALEYNTGVDQAQGTGFQDITDGVGNGNDESAAGTLHLFDPSNTTFVKHFMSTMTDYNGNDFNIVVNTAGYINTTTAITRIRFKFGSGNIDSGTIKMYGVS